jgi:hypothetical protein
MLLFLSFEDMIQLPAVCRSLRRKSERFFERSLVRVEQTFISSQNKESYLRSVILSANYCVVCPRSMIFSNEEKENIKSVQLSRINMYEYRYDPTNVGFHQNANVFRLKLVRCTGTHIRDLLNGLQGSRARLQR